MLALSLGEPFTGLLEVFARFDAELPPPPEARQHGEHHQLDETAEQHVSEDPVRVLGLQRRRTLKMVVEQRTDPERGGDDGDVSEGQGPASDRPGLPELPGRRCAHLDALTAQVTELAPAGPQARDAESREGYDENQHDHDRNP